MIKLVSWLAVQELEGRADKAMKKEKLEVKERWSTQSKTNSYVKGEGTVFLRTLICTLRERERERERDETATVSMDKILSDHQNKL